MVYRKCSNRISTKKIDWTKLSFHIQERLKENRTITDKIRSRDINHLERYGIVKDIILESTREISVRRRAQEEDKEKK